MKLITIHEFSMMHDQVKCEENCAVGENTGERIIKSRNSANFINSVFMKICLRKESRFCQ